MSDFLKNSNIDSLYSGYEEWKGWSKGNLSKVPSATNHDYFSREFKRANISIFLLGNCLP